MKTVRASKEYLPQMKTLWRRCFPDEETYVNLYFETFGTKNGLLLLNDDRVCAMVNWLPASYVQPDGDEQHGAYLYAVCTDPDVRNRGCCRRLLSEAETLLKGENCDFTFLRPGSEALAGMYEKLGYRMTLTHSELTVPAQPQPGTELRPASPETYLQLRQMQLWEAFIDWQLPAISFQAAQGELLTLSCDDRFAIAAIEQTGESISVKEYLGDPSLAGAIPAKYGKPSAKLRGVGNTPFAMTKPLTGKPLPTGYPGFVFD